MKTTPRRALGLGVRFNPSHVEAVALYLRRRVVGDQLPDVAGIIHEAEVYKLEPKELAAAYPRLPKTQSRFFFTTCKRQKAGNGHRMSRTAGPGSWVSNGKNDVNNAAGETIGTHESLKYVYSDKSRRTEWRMDEYHCCGLDHLAVVNGEERVLCRVYVATSSIEGSVTRQESAAGDRLLGMQQEPASAMAAAAQQQQQQPHRQEQPAIAMAVQQQQQRPQPRRREPVAPVLPAITRPQAIRNPPPPRALHLPSGPRHPCVTNTQQAPKRPAPQVVEPPRPKRMRPALAPLEVPPVRRHDVVGYNTPKQLSWFPAPAMPQRQPSPGNVAPPAEAPTYVMGDDDEFATMLEAELQELQAEEAGNDDDDGIMRFAESLESELEELPAAEEEGQHARSLEGLVADDRGDEVVAQDALDVFSTIDDAIDGTGGIDYSLPLSAYSDIQY